MAPAASALTLGEIELHSALAEPFDATIAVDSSSGTKGGSECFTMGKAPGAPGLPRATFAFETTAAGSRVRIRTKAAVNEPAVALRIHAACPGEGRVTRDYFLLLDPRSASSLPLRGNTLESAERATPSALKSADLSVPGFRAVAGDTLSGIAAAIFPRNRTAAAAYVEALRAWNPSLASLGADEAIAPGTVLILPDLRTFARSRSPGAQGAPRIPAAPAAPRAAASEPSQPAAKPQPPRPERAIASTSPAVSGFRAVEGDTFAGIAATIFPRDRAAAAAYVEALRTGNPSLASLDPDEAIAPGTVLILPDLHAFAKSRPSKAQAAPRAPSAPASPRAVTREPASAPAAMPKAPRPVTSEPAPPAAKPPPKPRAPMSLAPRTSLRAGKAGNEFVLRLSAVEMDLSRSRGVDDRMRAQLRGRLLLLDSDDQVAALLSLRESVRQLEGRVAQLQLKMTTSPPRVAIAPAPSGPAAPAQPSAVSEPQPYAAPLPPPFATKPEPPVDATKTEPKPEPPPIATKTEPPPIATKPESTPAEAKTEPKPEPPVVKALSAKPRPAEPAEEPGWPAWLWAVVVLLALAAGGLALRMMQRRPAVTISDAGPATEIIPGADARAALAAENDFPEASRRDGRASRATIKSDAELATRIPGADPDLLRRRYIEERFPEIANGAIVLESPDSVVKAARLLYEDGSIPRAVELLQFSVEDRPEQMKTWLALFEIFRLEGLKGEFAELANRFKEHHGATDNWRKVQYIGRELDPANPLYHDTALDNLETVGQPSAGKARVVTFDPLAENWLNTPMDFTSDALAADLRGALLADGGITESDLVPNPIPALKSAEMFSVA